MDDAIIAAGSALLGAAVGGAAVVLTSWWVAGQERRRRHEDADRAVRAARAEKQEEREVAEYRAYHDCLDARRVVMIAAVQRLLHGTRDSDPTERIVFVPPPPFIFTPPEITEKLDAANEEWRLLLVSVVGATQEGPNDEQAREVLPKVAELRTRVADTMTAWAKRLRAGEARARARFIVELPRVMGEIASDRPGVRRAISSRDEPPFSSRVRGGNRGAADVASRASSPAGSPRRTARAVVSQATGRTTNGREPVRRSIMRQGRWASRTMVDRCVRDASLFADNASDGIGL